MSELSMLKASSTLFWISATKDMFGLEYVESQYCSPTREIRHNKNVYLQNLCKYQNMYFLPRFEGVGHNDLTCCSLLDIW